MYIDKSEIRDALTSDDQDWDFNGLKNESKKCKKPF